MIDHIHLNFHHTLNAVGYYHKMAAIFREQHLSYLQTGDSSQWYRPAELRCNVTERIWLDFGHIQKNTATQAVMESSRDTRQGPFCSFLSLENNNSLNFIPPLIFALYTLRQIAAYSIWPCCSTFLSLSQVYHTPKPIKNRGQNPESSELSSI